MNNEKEEYGKKISLMSDEGLVQEIRQMCWLSAYAANNPRSNYHWKCDVTYDEAKRRGKTELYSKGHALAKEDAGY